LPISDLHLKKFADPRKGADLDEFFVKLLNTVVERNVEFVPFLGDWFNSKSYLHSSLCNLSHQYLAHLSELAFVIFIAGNHDQIRPDDPESTLRAFLPYGQVIETPRVWVEKELRFACLPFTRDVEVIRKFCSETEADVLLAHIELNGMRASGTWFLESPLEEKDLSPNRFKQILTGHAHWRQKIGNVLCIGSPYEMDFSDADSDERGLYVFHDTDISDFIPIKAPRYFIVEYPNELPQGGHYVRYVNVPKDKIEEVLRKTEKKGLRECAIVPKVEETFKPDDKVYTLRAAVSEYVDKACPESLDRAELVDLGEHYLAEEK
jgi:DNA repair exonuclease SbcCD nuclease subunit